MATRDIVPRADSEGGIGTTLKRWAAGWFDAINGKDISSGVATSGELSTGLDGKVSHSLATAVDDFLVASGAGAWVKKTLAEVKTILGLGSAAYTAATDYAVAAMGVTNGDSHDHNDGDGGTIDHVNLANRGTNTHTALDAFVSSKAAASGLASLDVSSKVVQDPANATATPTASKIPIADALGKLTAWIDAASTTVAGLVQLATNAIALAGTDATKAITAAALAYVLSQKTKGLISTNTTIYVRTDGNDSNDGSANDAAKAKASIAGALSSIAGKLIASGVTVTIQVADGTYTISQAITVDHPDADKIQILGNTSAETTVAIAAIDTTAKTITVAGNYASNADATKNILTGDVVVINGSGTSGLNREYQATGVTYSGGNTIVTCANDTFASSTVSGGVLIVKPCNRCLLSFSATILFQINRKVALINGFRVEPTTKTTSNRCVNIGELGSVFIDGKSIFLNAGYGIVAGKNAGASIYGAIVRGCTNGICSWSTSNVALGASTHKTFVSLCSIALWATGMSLIGASDSGVVLSANTTNYSPGGTSRDVVGNGNSIITSS